MKRNGARVGTPTRKPDADARRLHPRLRVYANCDEEVNALRADLSTAVASTVKPVEPAKVYSLADDDPSLAQRTQLFLEPEAVPQAPLKLRKSAKLADRPAPTHAFVNVFVQFMPPQQGDRGKQRVKAQQKVMSKISAAVNTVAAREVGAAMIDRRNFVAATIPVSMLSELKKNDAIAFVHSAEPLKLDVPLPASASAPKARAINGASSSSATSK